MRPLRRPRGLRGPPASADDLARAEAGFVSALQGLRRVKAALDPANLMNPGKVLRVR
ncbi:MAG: FAD-linked oxidase C-terminal domain-containing protein [Pseudomonadota bacterium]